MDWTERTRLLQSDPVTCARYFHNRVTVFLNDVLKSDHHPIGKIADYFYRVEFQQRGSPHIHMLIWVKDAPVFEQSDDHDIVDFINRYVSCSSDVSQNEKAALLIQTHKHSKTCRQKGKAICRFGYPIPPMPRTMILRPLSEDVTDSGSDDNDDVGDDDEILKQRFAKIEDLLKENKDGINGSFPDFLQTLELNEDQYIKAIRSSLKETKLFLKRDPCDIRVTAYANAYVYSAFGMQIMTSSLYLIHMLVQYTL